MLCEFYGVGRTPPLNPPLTMPSRKRAGVLDYELSLVTQNINTHDDVIYI